MLHPDPTDPNTGDYIEEGHASLEHDEQTGESLYQPPPALDGATPPAVMGRMKPLLISEPNVKYKGLHIETAPFRNPMLTIHELRIRYNPDGRGVRRLYVVIHLASRQILHADYLGSITPAGDLDMHAVTINKVPGRW